MTKMEENRLKETIDAAVKVLKSGGVILYPTDTVWGIGCDASDAAAVARIYEIKKRSDSKSLVLLASDMDMICRYVRQMPEMAVSLIEVNDRPMTIVYPDAVVAPRYGLAANCVAEDGSVGIRIPLSDYCRRMTARLGKPLVSTSANISGEPTPKSFDDISPAIKDAVDYIVCPELEKESTGFSSSVIKVGLDGEIRILRP